MGMVAVFRRIDDDNLTLLLKHPSLIHTFLDEEGPEPPKPKGFLSRLFGGSTTPPPALPPVERTPDDEVDLDKSWHAIHFLLTGTADETDDPLGFIGCGGTPVGKEEIGYGPARAFNAAQTAQIAELLKPIDREEILKRFDAPSLARAKIYPEIWSPERKDEENHLYVADNFAALRSFLLAATEKGQGFVTFLS